MARELPSSKSRARRVRCAIKCTRSPKGRKINIGVHEAALVRARARQQDPEWKANYQATRPKVERKLGHMMRRRHGARRSRVRGTTKIANKNPAT